MPFDCSPEAIDTVCDLWQKYGLKPVTKRWLAHDDTHHVVGACLLSIHARAAGLELQAEPLSIADTVRAAGFTTADYWAIADGFDGTMGDTNTPDYQYGAAVRRRLQERGLLDADA